MKFHQSTGVVLIQGAMYVKWREDYYPSLKSRVSELGVNGKDNAIENYLTDAKQLSLSDAQNTSMALDNFHDDENSDSSDNADDESAGCATLHDDCDKDDIRKYVKTLEQGYTRFCDALIEEMGDMKDAMKMLVEDIKKIPNKVSEGVKRDIEKHATSQEDHNKLYAENEYLKTRITALTEVAKRQSNELWRLKHDVARLRSPDNSSTSPNLHAQMRTNAPTALSDDNRQSTTAAASAPPALDDNGHVGSRAQIVATPEDSIGSPVGRQSDSRAMRQVAQLEQTAVPAQTVTASPSGPGCLTSDIQPTTAGTATSSHPDIDHAHKTRSLSAPPADGAVSSSDSDTSGESDSESLVFQDIRRKHPQDEKKQEAENILFGDSTINTLMITDIWAELLPIYNKARRPR